MERENHVMASYLGGDDMYVRLSPLLREASGDPLELPEASIAAGASWLYPKALTAFSCLSGPLGSLRSS